MTQRRLTHLRDSAGRAGYPLEPVEPSFDPLADERSGVRHRSLPQLEDSDDGDPIIEAGEVYLDELQGLDPETMALLEAEHAPAPPRPLDADSDPVIETREVYLDELWYVDSELMAVLEAECGAQVESSESWERFDVEVNFTGANNFFADLSMDVSQGGLFMTTWQPPPIGTNVLLSVALPGGRSISAPGVVQFVTDENDDDDDTPPGIGVAFLRLSDKDLSTIRQFCRKRRPTYFEMD